MNESRVWSILTVVVIIAILAGTWFVGIGPRLAESAKADEERGLVEDQNALHQIKLSALQELDANLASMEQELGGLRASVPQGTESAALLRQLEAAAAAFGVTLSTTSFEAPQPFTAPEVLPADVQVAAALTMLDNRGLFVLPAAIGVEGPRSAVIGFLNSLQSDQRLMLVHDVTFPDGLLAADSVVKATFAVQMFVLTGVPTVVEEPAEAAVAEAAP